LTSHQSTNTNATATERNIQNQPIPHLKLIIVDKENGGKADALNMGLNISTNKYVVCIDVDCLLIEDALLKLIKPFRGY
jgi:cellulose synthase/poly-beta-1,6-N-acetylglucosamine synthase-like glycosyltransferase